MTITLWLELLLLAVLLGLSAFFSSSETSLFSLSPRQLAEMRHSRNPRVDLIERMLNRPRRLIITILIGNELVNVAASVISAAFVIALLGADKKWLNIFIMVPVLLLFGEITPKTLAIRNNVSFATFQSLPIERFAWLITPLRRLVRTVADWCITLLVGRERSRGNLITEDMVRTLAREAVGEGALDSVEARYIAQIFEFGDKTVDEVMTPRAGIFFLPLEMPAEEMVAELQRTRYSKVPIYRGTRDGIVGILFARDLLGQDLSSLSHHPSRLRDILRQPYYVPETRSVADLFHTFCRRKLSLSIVLDEYGGVTGLVTMEDLLECIFGEFHSPSDHRVEAQFEKLDDRRWRVPGSTPIHRFNLHTAGALDESLTETVGGLVLHELGELPSPGSRVSTGGFSFTVVSLDGNRIEKLLVERLDGTDASERLDVGPGQLPLGPQGSGKAPREER